VIALQRKYTPRVRLIRCKCPTCKRQWEVRVTPPTKPMLTCWSVVSNWKKW